MLLFLELFCVGMIGLIIGSFLNVVILRLHTGRSTAGRSGCMSCRSTLRWFELLPVVSYFVLHGRCRSCGSHISQQYWIVEGVTALLFILVWIQGFALPATFVAWGIMATLVVIGVYDMRHTIIPDSALVVFLALAFLGTLPLYGTTHISNLFVISSAMLLDGIITAIPLFVLWFISHGRWMGFGDVKLVLGFGFVLGAYEGLMAVMFGFIFGACIGLCMMLVQKVIKHLPLSPTSQRLTMKSEIPFAPFLILGFISVFLFQIDLISLVGLLLYV